MPVNAAVSVMFIKQSKAVQKSIGHGIILKGDKKAQDFVSRNQICIEGCPTSNVHTKAITDYHQYPFREWLTAGVHFA